MELSIIITNYKNPELLKVCINSIKENFSLADYEIIVSDSDTEEVTRNMMKENFPEVTFFANEKNVGFQHLVRQGLEVSQGKILLVLNGDIIIKKNSIETLIDFMKNHPEAGMVGPKLLNFNDTFQASSFRFYRPMTIVYRRFTFLQKMGFVKKHLDWFLMKDYDHQLPKEVDWLMGSALMITREALEKVGPMDKRFRMYLEDTDWCRRFWENGLKVIYVPQSEMYHYHGHGSANKSVLQSLISNRLAWIHIASGIKYFIKYAGKELPKHD